MSSGHERRKYVRVSGDFQITVRYNDTVIEYPAAFARDISSGGIGIEIAGQYPDSFEKLTTRDDPVALQIDLGDGAVLSVTATVVWGQVDGEPAPGSNFKIGLKFLEIDPASREKLSAFIRRKIDEAVEDHVKSRVQRRTPPPGSLPSV